MAWKCLSHTSKSSLYHMKEEIKMEFALRAVKQILSIFDLESKVISVIEHDSIPMKSQN